MGRERTPCSHARHHDQRQIDEGPGSDRPGSRQAPHRRLAQQVVGAPGIGFSVAMAPSRGSFDRQITKSTLSLPSRVRRTGGWTSGDLLRLT